jgi:hypothetical protein
VVSVAKSLGGDAGEGAAGPIGATWVSAILEVPAWPSSLASRDVGLYTVIHCLCGIKDRESTSVFLSH